MYQRKKDGLYYDPATGRTWEHKGYATRIFWSPAMLSYLRRHYPGTLNEELAACLGVSQRTLIRKARELGLEKDTEWLRRIWDEHRIMAHASSRHKGYPGGFRKGERANPDGEFKPGQKRSEEMRRKQGEGMRRWYLTHPREASMKACKAWETRRKRIQAEPPPAMGVADKP